MAGTFGLGEEADEVVSRLQFFDVRLVRHCEGSNARKLDVYEEATLQSRASHKAESKEKPSKETHLTYEATKGTLQSMAHMCCRSGDNMQHTAEAQALSEPLAATAERATKLSKHNECNTEKVRLGVHSTGDRTVEKQVPFAQNCSRGSLRLEMWCSQKPTCNACLQPFCFP